MASVPVRQRSVLAFTMQVPEVPSYQLSVGIAGGPVTDSLFQARGTGSRRDLRWRLSRVRHPAISTLRTEDMDSPLHARTVRAAKNRAPSDRARRSRSHDTTEPEASGCLNVLAAYRGTADVAPRRLGWDDGRYWAGRSERRGVISGGRCGSDGHIPVQYHVALGDSIAAGVGASTTANDYVNLVYQHELVSHPGLQLVN